MKFGYLALVILLSAGTAFAVGKYTAAPATEQSQTKETAYQRVMRTGTIRCQYILYPKFIDRDPNTNKLSGLYVDFIEEMGKRLDLKIDWAVETGLADGLEGLNTGRYDVACIPYTPLPSRARAAEFSIPVFYTPVYTYARADDTRFDNNLKAINDPNITIAAMEGEMGQVIAAEDYPKAKVVTIPNLIDQSQVMMAVETGKADVATTEPSTAERYLEKNPGKLKRVNAPPVRLQSGGVSVAVGEEALKALLNTTIQSMIDTGYVERLFIQSEKDKEFYFLPAKTWHKAGE